MKESSALFIFFIFSIILSIIMLACSYILAPKTRNEEKSSPYECGINVQTDSRIKFYLQFFVYAILFLIFDIETIFIFPFAISFNFLGIFAFIEITIFIGFLLLGLIYVIKKRILRYK